jgi:hypothetical protein
MAEHQKQPLESDVGDAVEVCSTSSEEEEKAVCDVRTSDWEGYSPEILSTWFDPYTQAGVDQHDSL